MSAKQELIILRDACADPEAKKSLRKAIDYIEALEQRMRDVETLCRLAVDKAKGKE